MDQPDSTREKTAVHQYRLETIDRMLEKHQEALEANTLASQESAAILRQVAGTLEKHSEKLEAAIGCEERNRALEARVSLLEKKETASVLPGLPGDTRRYVQIALVVLGVLYPALYQKLMSPSGPIVVTPQAQPQPPAVVVTPAP